MSKYLQIFQMRILLGIALTIFIFSGTLFAYDVELAKKFDAMFSQLNPQVLTMRPCQITTKDILDMIKKNEDFVILDIRTPAEQKIIAPVWKGSLLIPMHELFKPENLAKLPKDKKIAVICHTGDRAAAATIALRAIGFSNAFQFKGGMVELAREIGRTATEYVKD
ncbi:MAG: rhodanese-like domain-containing protein [Thermodesulfovibrio sp.]|jgi:rhodanese-related sulfurtransferase|uniref:rhodanese-like domain-containing protein n=1 Tax=unclassified Thermodesulfovibrio TaxID=2645936 RepID=UPI00085702F3|nr:MULTISPECIES: rhodanese-like domain-containing protein [unclassified Thermodesulfovibrio]MDI1472219.1 rhodanese-like domain-containing protein [Thermodesulfovibrio sp. 1176]MDI6714081.1 rhodanese-like domain-containing protein [Thermodesulfovibrio sp.]ODA44597.1 Sulfur carrier protein adenylyltransferase ThiF [Thermodesulfovibrio sp. N1]